MAQVASFDTYVYTSDAGKKYPIRLSDKSANVTPAPAKGTYDDGNVKVSVSKHGQKRRTGIQARGFVIGLPSATEVSVPYAAKTFVPIVTKTAFDAVTKGADFTYDGGTWKVLDKVSEA